MDLTFLTLSFGLVIALVAVAAVARARRVLRDDGRLRLYDAVHGQGLALPGGESEAAARNCAHAVRRCLSCADHARCDPLLAAGDWTSLREFCPNTGYIDRLRAG